jgi:phytanoyl-CoA hydroxylase
VGHARLRGQSIRRLAKAYVIAYRSKATVAHERSIGFTHSHNDRVNWITTLGAYEEQMNDGW